MGEYDELHAALDRLGHGPQAHLGGFRTTLERFEHINALFKIFGVDAKAGIRQPMPFTNDNHHFHIVYKIIRESPGKHSTTIMAHYFKTTDELAAKAHEMMQEVCNG